MSRMGVTREFHQLQIVHLQYSPVGYQFEGWERLTHWDGQILGVGLSGVGCLEWAGHHLRIERGHTYLIHLHQHDYVFRNLTDEIWTIVWMYFKPHPEMPALQQHQIVPEILLVEQLLHRMVQSFHAHDHDAAQVWFEAVLLELLQRGAGGLTVTEQQQRHSYRLNELIRKIRARPQDDWTIDRMSAESALSPSQFTRVFRAHTGQSPRQFLVATRLEVACSFLELTPMSIGRIAEELCYSDAFAFSKQFKSRYGMSPSEWRESKGL